ncbi:MAG: cell wall-binding repeat-containing protein [Anaerovoracaceae bacterium]
MKKTKRVLITLMCIMLYNAINIGAVYGYSGNPDIYRVGGNNRYDTAIAIAEDGWEYADSVVLANGDDFADALAGVPLAVALDAPILVTRSDRIDNEILETIEKLNAGTIYILGGPGAISTEVERQLNNYEIIRLAGDTRFETSVRIAEELARITGIESQYVFVAYAHNYPDALAISSVAACMEAPIIYAPKNGSIDTTTANFLRSAHREKAVILGGPSVISNSVLNSIKNTNVNNVSRLYGDNRYETCVRIYEEYGFMFDFSNIVVATGNDFPDALSGGAYAGKKWLPIILADNIHVQPAINNFVEDKLVDIVYAIGGQGAVSDNAIKNMFPIYENPGYDDGRIKVTYEGTLPDEFTSFLIGGRPNTKVLIKEIEFTMNEDHNLELRMLAQKTYDKDGYEGRGSCNINCIIRDEKGIVVYNNFFNESRLSVGDMFYFETTIYDMPEGVYTMELSDDR